MIAVASASIWEREDNPMRIMKGEIIREGKRTLEKIVQIVC